MTESRCVTRAVGRSSRITVCVYLAEDDMRRFGKNQEPVEVVLLKKFHDRALEYLDAEGQALLDDMIALRAELPLTPNP